MKQIIFLLSLLTLFHCPQIFGQTVERIADINPGPNGSYFGDDFVSIEYDGKFLFTATDGVHGDELWVYDGTTTTLLKDIFPGPKSSEAQNFFLINDKVIFNARDSIHGEEWWITDGTPEGTVILIDIYPGPADGAFVQISTDRRYHFMFNGEVYFSGTQKPNDWELWKTDGTEAGTKLVKNIAEDSGSFNSPSYPSYYAEHQGALYFSCYKGLWKTDGTTAGTVLVQDKDPEDVFGLLPLDLISSGDLLVFLNSTDLWRSDGTPGGTFKIKDLEQVSLAWLGHRFTRLGDFVLFPGDDGIHGDELWRTDGNVDETYMVVDLHEGPEGYAPQNNIFFKNKMYYKGDDGKSGIEFWSSDGTVAGTTLVKDIYPGSTGGFYLPSTIYTDGELIYLSAGPPFQKELWISDGTTNGTYKIDINPEGESYPAKFKKYGDKIFFYAFTEDFGYEPYILDAITANKEIHADKPFKVFPNPTNGIIHIESESELNFLHTVYDIKGNIVISSVSSSLMDLSSLSPGTYILKTIDGNSGITYVEKIILTR